MGLNKALVHGIDFWGQKKHQI